LGTSTPDGQAIQAALALGPGGVLFGVANGGGSATRGTVFRLERSGSGYSILRHFAGGTDGANPQSPMLTGSDGLLYGTTATGGEGFGTIYRLRPDGGDYQVIYRPRVATTDGSQPRGPLVEKPRGVLWGCTVLAGMNNAGVIFRARTDGTDYRVIHHFGTGTNDGKTPMGGLTLDAAGWLTGTTSAGGAAGVGTIFRFDPNSLVLRIDSVSLNAVITWEGGDNNETDEVETAVGWSNGQPVWEGFGAEIEFDGNRRRSVIPLQAVPQLLFRVKRGP
jgi:uncharacterized repeat protein (TIGR03803 family)